MKRLVMMVLVLVAIGGTTEVNAQSFLKKLGKKVENAAKNAIERNAERKTEEAVDKVFEGDFGKGKKDKDKQNNNGNNNADAVYDNGNATAQTQPQKGQSLEMTYAKSDFVPGDEIFFEDNQANEQLGEFPSQWDLISGTIEIAKLNGENTICFTSHGASIAPLMKDMENYLPEMFTIEFDYLEFPNQYTFRHRFYLRDGNKDVLSVEFAGADSDVSCRYYTPSGDSRKTDDGKLAKSIVNKNNGWNHFALSFNKRACKIYINGTRVANIPNMAAPKTLQIWGATQQDQFTYIKNVRIAKGAVPLYDRMMSDGKFITYGITFDVGKATIKPESMGEINRIVQLMNENPHLKFSVEGHTDSTGNPASNQTLSEQRSQAIVAKLVEMGIAQDRLTAVGKGQNNPIADNSTDEGRAKNRRVEFVKM